GLMKIKEADDIEEKLNEVERLLKNAINMPCKTLTLQYSRSEVMLTFFERSPLDQVLRNDKVHRIQPCFQSPVKISEIMRSNGFCLANTETIVLTRVLLKRRTDPRPQTLWNIYTRMEVTFSSWSLTCAARTRRRTSPTCPTTTWSRLRPTSWNDCR
ncbi:unnamed protein product, partial [Tetraodon nigroviridis]